MLTEATETVEPEGAKLARMALPADPEPVKNGKSPRRGRRRQRAAARRAEGDDHRRTALGRDVLEERPAGS